VDQNNQIVGDKEAYQKVVKHQEKRVVTVAEWVKKGLQ